MQRHVAALILLLLFWGTNAPAAGFPDEIRYATQLRWVSVEGALSLTDSPDKGPRVGRICSTGSVVDHDTRIWIPLLFGEKIRIEAGGSNPKALNFRYVFGTPERHAAMVCEDMVPSGNDWVLLSRMDEGYLEVTASESTQKRIPLRLYRAESRMRSDFWDELTEQMLAWIRKGVFEANARQYLAEIPATHPAAPVIRFILVRIPPAWGKDPSNSKIYKKYLKTLIAYRVNQERLLRDENTSLVRAFDEETDSDKRFFDGIHPYVRGSRFRYKDLRPGFYVLDTRVGYSNATLHDLRRYRTEIRIDNQPVSTTLNETTLYRGWRGNGKQKSLAGIRRRSIVHVGRKQQELEIIHSSPVWCRLAKAAKKPRFGMWVTGMASPEKLARGIRRMLESEPGDADSLFASAVMYNLAGRKDSARNILTSLMQPLDKTTADTATYREQLSIRLEGCRAQERGRATQALEMLDTLYSHLASAEHLDAFWLHLFQLEIAELASRLLALEGAYAKAASVIEPLWTDDKADGLLRKQYLQTMLHSSVENPARRSLPGIFQKQLSGMAEDGDLARLQLFRRAFLQWSQINHVLKSRVVTETFFDRIEGHNEFAPVLDSSQTYYPYAFDKSVKPDLRQGFPEPAPAPRFIKGALLESPVDAKLALLADQAKVSIVEIRAKPREFEFELPAGTTRIRPTLMLQDPDVPANPILLLTLPPISDRLRKPLPRSLQRYVKRSYERLPKEGLEFAFTTTAAETGLRILIRSDANALAVPGALTAIVNGAEKDIHSLASGQNADRHAPYQMQMILPPGDHRVSLIPGTSMASDSIFVQVAIEEHRTGLYEVDRCLP